MNPSDEQRRRQASGVARGPGPAPLNPLENFSNWSSYVADVPPVLLIRVTPRLVEGFWTKVARGAASTQGVSLPPIKRFKSGFGRLRAFCGDAEVLPVHPFRLEQRVSETEAIYEGLYAFDPGALAPSCGTVKLTFYSEKAPETGDSKVVDPKVLQQIWDDFEPYRAGRSARLPARACGSDSPAATADRYAGASPGPRTREPRTRDLLSTPHDDVAEAVHVEAGAADERAVDVLVHDQRVDVVRLDAAAVDHVAVIAGRAAEPLSGCASGCGRAPRRPAPAWRCVRCRSPRPARRR